MTQSFVVVVVLRIKRFTGTFYVADTGVLRHTPRRRRDPRTSTDYRSHIPTYDPFLPDSVNRSRRSGGG